MDLGGRNTFELDYLEVTGSGYFQHLVAVLDRYALEIRRMEIELKRNGSIKNKTYHCRLYGL